MGSREINTVQWISWIAATVVAATTLSAFAFMQFESKEDSRSKKEDLERRLDRIESKIDVIMERKLHGK